MELNTNFGKRVKDILKTRTIAKRSFWSTCSMPPMPGAFVTCPAMCWNSPCRAGPIGILAWRHRAPIWPTHRKLVAASASQKGGQSAEAENMHARQTAARRKRPPDHQERVFEL